MSAAALELAVEPVAEPVVAWRVWLLGPDRLLPVNGPALGVAAWAGPVNKAECMAWPARQRELLAMLYRLHGKAEPEPVHEAPDADCMCGFWALRDFDALVARFGPAALANQHIVFGTVELWGRIIEGTQGFRAEYARPREIYLNGPEGVGNFSLAYRYTPAKLLRKLDSPLVAALAPGRRERCRWLLLAPWPLYLTAFLATGGRLGWWGLGIALAVGGAAGQGLIGILEHRRRRRLLRELG